MRQSAEVDRLTATQTETAVQKSRAFLERRLTPDLQRAKERESTLAKEKMRYESLLTQLTGWKQQQRQGARHHTILSPLGRGIHVPAHVDTASSYVIVSMGLSTASETAWSTRADGSEAAIAASKSNSVGATVTDTAALAGEAGLYAELTIEEALSFSRRKIDVLNTKLTLARERTALIEGHIELTSKSIQQLEALQQDPSASFLDYLT